MICLNIKKLILSSVAVLVAVSSAPGHFEDTPVGVRPAGFAGAYTAGQASPEALYYNPSSIAQVKEAEISSSYSRMFMGLTDGSNLGEGFIGAVLPLGRRLSAGAAWQNFALRNYYSENTFYLGLAGEITERFYGGITMKILRKGYGKTDYTQRRVDLETGSSSDEVNPVFADGYSVTGFTPDIGVLYSFSDRITAGLSLSNLLQPDMALWSEDTDRVPMIGRAGLKYRVESLEFLGDVSCRAEDITFALGAQKDFTDVASVRGGLALGSREYSQLSLGASLNHGGIFRIDYSFSYPLGGIRGTYGTHRAGLSFMLGDIMSREITAEDRRDARELLGEAEGHMRRGEFDEAIRLLSRAMRLDRELEEARRRRGEARQQRAVKREIERDARRKYLGGVNELSKENFEKALDYFSSVMSIDDRGWNEIRKIKEETAKKLEELSDRKEGHVDNLLTQAGDLIDEQNYRRAKDVLERALALEERDEALRMLSDVNLNLVSEYYTEGMNLFVEEEYARALELFGSVVEIDPKHSQAMDMIERIRRILE